jgi:hypothetical protein
MKRVEQTILSPPDGNCFAACVASILELPIESVPNYRTEGDDWMPRRQAWLRPLNLCFLGWEHTDNIDPRVFQGYSICTVAYRNRDGDLRHSCVALDGSIVWNPHPLRDTREHDYVSDWIVFQVLDPSKMAVPTRDAVDTARQ